MSHDRVSMDVHLTGVRFIDVYLMGVYLTGVYLAGVHLTGRTPHGCVSYGRIPRGRAPHRACTSWVCTSWACTSLGVHLIYESSLRAGPGWRESLYRHQGCFEASDCGRLGRQAAGHPWSALRVVKSCRKTAQRLRCCSKPKQQLCI
jgi:hypothetical protein